MPSQLRTNLRRLNPSRKWPVPGDVFAMQLPDGRFVHGRVAMTDARGPMRQGIVIYIYSGTSLAKAAPELSRLTPDRLAMGPIFTNRQPWLRGYFETVQQVPFSKEDMLPVHCFYDPVFHRYVDENRQELPRAYEPCGEYSLAGILSIDDDVSDAFGIARIPDWERGTR